MEGISFLKVISKNRRRAATSDVKTIVQKFKEYEKSWNHSFFPITDPKDMGFWDLPHKEFKIAVLKKLTEL